MAERQQVLHLWLAEAALDTAVIAWSWYDGAGNPPPTECPYRTGVEALAAGWFLLQAPGPIDPAASNGELSCEYVFERRVAIDGDENGCRAGDPVD